MRGRNNGGGGNNNNNNGRKGPNPLTRNYESNGPDVKIRGSAQQIAEKYATLARDAQSAGDRVMAENYLQHAEHYNRIIAAAQAQMPAQHMQSHRDELDDDGDAERDEFDNQGNVQPANVQTSNAEPEPQAQASAQGTGPQPVIEGMPVEVALSAEASVGNAENRGRGRGRRPAPVQAQPHQPQEQAAEQVPAVDPASEQPEAEERTASPRRGRRPRRGERQPAGEAVGGSSDEAAPEGQAEETVLAAANG